MKKVTNNKGMAIVTVLIAIMFIGILATSMMYMAYMNYASKSVRYSSTDNFYTAEYGLADLSTALQNKAANASTVEAAFQEFSTEVINNDVFSTPILTTYNGVKCYNCYALQELIQNASKEAKIEVFTSDEYAADTVPVGQENRWPKVQNYTLDTKSITFLGVKVRSTTSDGFVSTITTDIKITFDSSEGEMDVNDFSVISDSSMYLNNKDVIFSGNIYVGKNNSYVDSDGTKYALALENISVVSILSQRAIINGNVIVKSGCTLLLSGNITVYGKIVVERGGTLIVTGDLVHRDALVCKDGSILKGISESHAADPSLTEVPVDGDGDGVDDGELAKAILTSVYFYVTDGYPKGWHEVDIDTFMNNSNSSYPGSAHHASYTSATKKSSVNPSKYISVHFGLPNPSNDLSDALVINGSNSIQVRGDNSNVTIVSLAQVDFFGDHKGVYMSSLSDEDYDNAKNILIKGSGQMYGTESDGTSWSGNNIASAGGDLNDTVFFPVADALQKYEISSANPTLGTKGRTVYFKDNENYIPAGYFIAENSSTVLSKAFSVGSGEADPKNSAVTYSRWTKE